MVPAVHSKDGLIDFDGLRIWKDYLCNQSQESEVTFSETEKRKVAGCSALLMVFGFGLLCCSEEQKSRDSAGIH